MTAGMENPIQPLEKVDFNILYQTKLQRFVDAQGRPIEKTGLDTSYEITVVAGFKPTRSCS